MKKLNPSSGLDFFSPKKEYEADPSCVHVFKFVKETLEKSKFSKRDDGKSPCIVAIHVRVHNMAELASDGVTWKAQQVKILSDVLIGDILRTLSPLKEGETFSLRLKAIPTDNGNPCYVIKPITEAELQHLTRWENAADRFVVDKVVTPTSDEPAVETAPVQSAAFSAFEDFSF